MPIVTGIFKISEIQEGKIILVPNENWYGKDKEQVFSPVPKEYYLDSIKFDI